MAKTTFDVRALFLRLPRLLFLLLAALTAVPAVAADLLDMSLESLMNVTVAGASRYEQKITEAPSYASIVTAEDIKKNGYRNLGDLLRTLPGVYVSYNRIFPTVGFRGFLVPGSFNSRVLLLVDGHVVNNSVYEHAPVGNDFPVDIDLVERVEVVRGPSSSLYGANAFFGVINVITKRGGNIDGVEASGSAGSWRTFAGRATLGKEFSGGRAPPLRIRRRQRGAGPLLPRVRQHGHQQRGRRERRPRKVQQPVRQGLLGRFHLRGGPRLPEEGFAYRAIRDGLRRRPTNAEDLSGYVDLRYEKDLANA